MKSYTKYNREKVQQVHTCSKKPLAHTQTVNQHITSLREKLRPELINSSNNARAFSKSSRLTMLQ